ncbi:MAG: LysR family transcriptional regulator [Gammaproteobacteria bacterium]|nr:LysR family transcriptional regulator [Gammaproteobacteria bacterium]
MLDQLRQLAIFAKTIDHGSFRGAARALRLSPSVVSHHISQLEESLGVVLIYRSTRKLSLTLEGERLLVAVHRMLEAVEEELVDLSSSAMMPTGELRLTVPSVLSQSRLTDSIGAFSMKYPGITLSLDFSDVRQDIIEGGYDVAIQMGLKKSKSASTRTLFSVKRQLVASKSYLADRPKVSRPEEISDWDWLELAPVYHIKPSFKKAGAKLVSINPTARISANDAQALYRLARFGTGLAIVPEFLATEDIDSGTVEHVLPDWNLDPAYVTAAWPANAPKHGLIKLLVNELSQDETLKNTHPKDDH